MAIQRLEKKPQRCGRDERGKPYLYDPLLRARPRLLSVLCMSPTVSPSSPADSHNWSAAPRGASNHQNHGAPKKEKRRKKQKKKEETSAAGDEVSRLLVVPGSRSLFCTPKSLRV
ncbi:uncharacterized protein V6R79_010858 [Siganus canaliculatus]